MAAFAAPQGCSREGAFAEALANETPSTRKPIVSAESDRSKKEGQNASHPSDTPNPSWHLEPWSGSQRPLAVSSVVQRPKRVGVGGLQPLTHTTLSHLGSTSMRPERGAGCCLNEKIAVLIERFLTTLCRNFSQCVEMADRCFTREQQIRERWQAAQHVDPTSRSAGLKSRHGATSTQPSSQACCPVRSKRSVSRVLRPENEADRFEIDRWKPAARGQRRCRSFRQHLRAQTPPRSS
ncbi:MAG: hypothetical protein ACI8Y4_000399 [Candidatus Poriferisodalaceae bacterium]